MKSSKKTFNSKLKKTKKIVKKQKGGLSLCPKTERELQNAKLKIKILEDEIDSFNLKIDVLEDKLNSYYKKNNNKLKLPMERIIRDKTIEKIKREKQERLEIERLEKLEREKQERLEIERLKKLEKLEKEKLEKERLEKEKLGNIKKYNMNNPGIVGRFQRKMRRVFKHHQSAKPSRSSKQSNTNNPNKIFNIN